MLRAAIVEDQKKDRQELARVLARFSAESGEQIQITEFHDAMDFLEQRKADFHMVFLDIQMPFMDGLTAARKFRERNSQAALVFVTGMAQYAVKGYEVDAMDYLVKPLNYFDFALKMRRVVRFVHSRENQQFLIRTKNSLVKTFVNNIRYVEVMGHKVIYHLEERTVETSGTMKKAMEELPGASFALCNNCYYVNLYYVTAVEGYTVSLGETQLIISHPKKKSFLKALNDYVGGSSL